MPAPGEDAKSREILMLKRSLDVALASLPRPARVTAVGPVRVQKASATYDSPVWWAPAGLQVGDEVMVANVENGLAVVAGPRDPNATK